MAPTFARAQDSARAAPPRTIFHASTADSAAPSAGVRREASPDDGAAIRIGEWVAAPWVASRTPVAGRIVASDDVPAIPLTESDRRLQPRERLLVTAPAGGTIRIGDRFLAFRHDSALAGVGVVLVPTGVVVVDGASGGAALRAHVAAEFGELLIGQSLVPLDAPPVDRSARPRAVSNGPEARVAWISGGNPVLPTLLSYLVLRDGGALRAGDQVTLLREPRVVDGVTLPETEIAVARVLRVGGGAASAIVLRQSEPAIRIGTLARLTARLP